MNNYKSKMQLINQLNVQAIDDCLSISYLTTEYKCFLKNSFNGGKGISLAGGKKEDSKTF